MNHRYKTITVLYVTVLVNCSIYIKIRKYVCDVILRLKKLTMLFSK